ncbi:SWIM zinc finger family protein [Haloarchaeobius sp. DFWS5]|uniref:SWIM zinc finger family protein n=1 Tax=Haloarchaeobius sp. DFWS5 TaxID=3446114 RepID=UPI003EB84F53
MVAIACDGDEYVGRCDCRGFEYQSGPCAHLCMIRKAEFIDAETIDELRRRGYLTRCWDPIRPQWVAVG